MLLLMSVQSSLERRVVFFLFLHRASTEAEGFSGDLGQAGEVNDELFSIDYRPIVSLKP